MYEHIRKPMYPSLSMARAIVAASPAYQRKQYIERSGDNYAHSLDVRSWVEDLELFVAREDCAAAAPPADVSIAAIQQDLLDSGARDEPTRNVRRAPRKKK